MGASWLCRPQHVFATKLVLAHASSKRQCLISALLEQNAFSHLKLEPEHGGRANLENLLLRSPQDLQCVLDWMEKDEKK
eukprot:78197-Amphidinium_carterae.1